MTRVAPDSLPRHLAHRTEPEDASSPASTFAGRLQARRKELGLTQDQVAARITEALGGVRSVSRAAYAQWELGLTSPDLEKIRITARVLATRPSFLAFGGGENAPPVVGSTKTAEIDEVAFVRGRIESVAQWRVPVQDLLGSEEIGSLRFVRVPREGVASNLRRGSPVLVDTGVQAAEHEGVYAYLASGKMDMALMSPRPSRNERPRISVRSGNAVHEVDPDELEIVGKVVGAFVSL